MTDGCDCNSWATDLRIGYPNGHHPRCPDQPEPSRPVELLVSAELLAEGFFKLPGAVILNAKMDITPVLDPGRVKLVVEMLSAPEHAVSMDPIYTSRFWPDGRYRDYYLSGITWRLADGSSTTQKFDPPADENPTPAGGNVTAGSPGP